VAIAHGLDPAMVAATIARVVAASGPRLHYRAGRDAVWLPVMMALLPRSLFERGLRLQFLLDR